MAQGFQTVVATILGVLPGALYTWGFERQAGNWGVGLADRLLRFLGLSALFHVLMAPVTFSLWRTYFVYGSPVSWTHLPWTLWLVAIALIAIPFLIGGAVGKATRKGKAWPRWFTGPDPAPRAWDHFFAQAPDGWMRLKLKSGVWIGGAFAPLDGLSSYASGYPEPQDLFLATLVEVDPDSGEFLLLDGEPVLRESSLLVSWQEVEFMEFIDA